jgi:hypothetical protein
MAAPTEIDGWDEAAVRSAPGDVLVAARSLPNPPPSDLLARIVPTTAGCETPEDACETARLAAAILGHRRVCVVIDVDGSSDEPAEVEARATLVAEGFDVQNPNSSGS